MRRVPVVAVLVAFAIGWLMAATTAHAQIKAFPQAEGFGAKALGGRGGDVYHVTNLNDTGAGSLRFGIDNAPSSGRTIVFDVGGWITVASKLGINSDKKKITIAGQTAPGGIGVRGNQFSVGGDDIVIRHMRFRPGKGAGRVDSAGANVDAERVIYDHVSAGFSYDENFSVQATDLTLQFSDVTYGLEDHSAGSLLENPHRLSMHHNLYAHNSTRNPKHRVHETLDWIDNVIYNWSNRAFYMEGTDSTGYFWTSNIDGNYFIAGPNQDNTKPLSGGSVDDYGTWWGTNAYDSNENGVVDGQNYVRGQANFSDVSSALTTWSDTPYPVSNPIWKDASPQAAYDRVLGEFGATPWDRDEIDTLLANDVMNGQGNIISHENQLVARGVSNAGFGTLGGGAAPTDTDGDGIPNSWETKHGTNPSVANNNGDFDFDGYTDLEEYLNDLAAFPATGPLEFTGVGRYADWKRWTNRWEPSRMDQVRVTNGAAFIDAVGQKAKTLQLGGDAGASGRMYITSGWLEVTDGVAIGGAGKGRVEQYGGELRVLAGSVDVNNGQYLLRGGVLRTPELTKGVNGQFAFTGGVLQANLVDFSLVNDGGTIAPGTGTAGGVGQTNVLGNLTLNSGTLQIELASALLADTVITSGAAQLGGSLSIVPIGGFTPTAGQSWQILTATSFIGAFSSITSGFSVAQIANSLWLNFGAGAGSGNLAIPEPASLSLLTIALLAVATRRRNDRLAISAVCLVMLLGFADTTKADTSKVIADAQLSENGTTGVGDATNAGSGTGTNLNARWAFAASPPNRNEWIALKFDLSAYSDKSRLANVALRTTMFRTDPSNATTLQLYALTPGTAGEDWPEVSIVYGSMPGFTFDANSTTNVLDVGGALTSLGTFSVSGVNNEGNVSLINPASLTSFAKGLGTHNLLTLLLSCQNSATAQWRIASREATATMTSVLTGPAGSFAPYLQFDVGASGIGGDYNDDGEVDTADYVVWRERLGMSSITNEEVSPTTVDIADYLYWRERYGATTPGGAGAIVAAAVPEPASAGLFVLVGVATQLIRRRVR